MLNNIAIIQRWSPRRRSRENILTEVGKAQLEAQLPQPSQ